MSQFRYLSTQKTILSIGLILFSLCSVQAQGPKKRLNVLFIAVDDLRPELNCYGASHMRTPNIDRLARRSVLFERAYCQQAVCAPSRNSILTGLRPDAMGIYDLNTFFRTKVPNVVTLPELFKRNGYQTERMGKIYHTAHGNQDDEQSWAASGNPPAGSRQALKKITRGDTIGLESDFPKIGTKNLPYYCSDAPEEAMSDGMIANRGVERLKALKDSTFFLAVGFAKPHLPFVAPRKFWELYDPASIQIPARTSPTGMPDLALMSGGELRAFHGIPEKGFLDDETSRKLIHGYYASISMIDAQIGKLLDALDENGLAQNTIVVLWGDHGYKLGDYGTWCKHSNVELDTNVPLLISAPGMSQGVKTQSLAELVGLYPTLCELAGIKKPAHLEGKSLVPVLKNPNVVVNQVAISQYPRGKMLGYDRKTELMGYSIRAGNYRYTRWQQYENPENVVAVELYDHKAGKKATENLAKKPEFKSEVSRLDKLLSTELSHYTLLKSHPAETK